MQVHTHQNGQYGKKMNSSLFNEKVRNGKLTTGKKTDTNLTELADRHGKEAIAL